MTVDTMAAPTTGVGRQAMQAASSWTATRPSTWWTETSIVLPRKGAVNKLFRRVAMSSAERTADIAAAPDRDFLRQHVFPAAAARGGDILFVGVRAYTQPYYTCLESEGGVCWTIDVDPSAAAFGQASRHIVGSVLDIADHFGDRSFATIIMAGVLGFGVNRRRDQVAAILACGNALAEDGTLVLSWNDRRLHCGVLEDALLADLEFTSWRELPPRLWMLNCDQQFAFLRRCARSRMDGGDARVPTGFCDDGAPSVRIELNEQQGEMTR